MPNELFTYDTCLQSHLYHLHILKEEEKNILLWPMGGMIKKLTDHNVK